MILENIQDLIYETVHHYRNNIKIGSKVCIVKKLDQRSGVLTCGIVKRLLTSKSVHTRGIKVEIYVNGTNKTAVGRVQKII